MKKGKSKLWSVLLCLAFLAGLFPAAALPVWADIGNSWSGSIPVNEEQTLGSVDSPVTITLTGDTTLMLNSNLIINGSIISADNESLSVIGPGTLTIKAAKGEPGIWCNELTVDKGAIVTVNSAAGDSGLYGGAGNEGIVGDVTLYSGKLTVTGGNGGNGIFYGGNGGYGGEGGTGIYGDVTVYSGTLTVTGGAGGAGDSDAGTGGNGGIGIDGNVTVNVGEFTVNGGDGGKGGTGGTGGNGGNGIASAVNSNKNTVICSGGSLTVTGGKGATGGNGICVTAVLGGGVLNVNGGKDGEENQSAAFGGDEAGVSYLKGYNYGDCVSELTAASYTFTPEKDVAKVTYQTGGTPQTEQYASLHEALYPTRSSDNGGGAPIILLKDVETASTIVIDKGGKTLDLNGHSITFVGDGPVICLAENSSSSVLTYNSFQLMDEATEKPEHVYYINDEGVAIVTNESDDKYTSAATKGSFSGGYITGGNSTGGNSDAGGGVYVDNDWIFQIYGVTIIGNQAELGGGVYARGMSSISMTGGAQVIGNKAERGGGVYAECGAWKSSGKGSDPTYSYPAEFTISGEVKIQNNGTQNVLLCKYPSGAAAVPEKHTGDPVITVTGPLTGGAGSIGVTMEEYKDGSYKPAIGAFAQAYKDEDPAKSYNSGSLTVSDAAKFKSDSADYAVKLDEGVALLAERVAVESVKLSKTSLSLNPGRTAALTVTIAPKDADPAVKWISSDESVATVDESGKVKAVKVGTATITVISMAADDKSATCTVTVSAPSSSSDDDDDDDWTPSTPSTPANTTTETTPETTTNADGSKTESTSKTETTTNADGSVTEKTTESATTTTPTGEKTESKSEVSVTTKENADGTTTETTTATETATMKDASGKTTGSTETKTESTETLDKDGNGTVEGTKTETVKDASGKVTETTVTESKGTVETDESGTKTATLTNTATTTDAATGEQTTAVTTEEKAETKNGTTADVVKDENGNVLSAEANVSEKALQEAQKAGEPVQIPMEIAPVMPEKTDGAVPVAITMPESTGGSVAQMPRVEIAVPKTGPGIIAMIRDMLNRLIPVKECYEGSVIVPVSGSCEIVIVDNTKTFADVAADAWYRDNVTFVTAREIFNGTGDGNFTPNAAMTRGMLAQVLYNFDRNASPKTSAFADTTGKWYADAAGWANSAGVVTGTGSGFEGEANVTREQVAVMLYRYAKTLGADVSASADLSGFADADKVSAWALDAMRWAVGQGLINGIDGRLVPQGSATRAQLAAIMTRFVRNAK